MQKNAQGLGRDEAVEALSLPFPTTIPLFPQAPKHILFSCSLSVYATLLSESLEQATF